MVSSCALRDNPVVSLPQSDRDSEPSRNSDSHAGLFSPLAPPDLDSGPDRGQVSKEGSGGRVCPACTRRAICCITRRADGGLELPAKVVQERREHASAVISLFPRGDDGGARARDVRETWTRHIRDMRLISSVKSMVSGRTVDPLAYALAGSSLAPGSGGRKIGAR
jgi:hypothetical protein